MKYICRLAGHIYFELGVIARNEKLRSMSRGCRIVDAVCQRNRINEDVIRRECGLLKRAIVYAENDV